MFNFGKVTAQVDLEYEGWQRMTNEVEQAFVSYDLGNGLSVTLVVTSPCSGLEAKEPTGLYQFSTAYDSATGGIDLPPVCTGCKYLRKSGDNFYAYLFKMSHFDKTVRRLGGDDGDPATLLKLLLHR